MMNNRFEKCKSLVDLYSVFATADGIQEYSNLSAEELERVAIVFEANIPDKVAMPDVPLTSAGYNYIWNVVVEEVETETTEDEMEESIMMNTNDVTVNEFKEMMEESVMGKGKKVSKVTKVKMAVNNAVYSMKNTMSSVKTNIGNDRESLTSSCDGALNEIKNTMGPVLEILDDALGCTALKEEICSIMYDTLNGVTSKSGFFKMASKCREAIDRKIKLLSLVDPDDKLGKVAALRALAGEDEDGTKIIEVQSIWSAFASSVVWICKKVTRKLRSWFGVEAESNIFGATGAAIAQVFAKVGNVIKNAAKIAGTVLSYAVSYAVAGVIKITSLVITAIKFVVSKIKGWYEAAKTKLTKEDVEDLEFEDSELEFAE